MSEEYSLDDLKVALRDFREGLRENYCSRMGDEDINTNKIRERIVEILETIKYQPKEVLGFWIFRIMNEEIKKQEFTRFNSWCQSLANELVEEFWVD